jgi:hypothetical protein
MKQKILEFIKKHDGYITALHLYEEFDYLSKPAIDKHVSMLFSDGKIKAKSGFMKIRDRDFPFLHVAYVTFPA